VEGFIKLYRKLLENPIICKDSDYLAVWIYLLLNATHKEYPALFKGKKIILQPGQLITGRKSISTKLNISESKVQRILKTFENEQQIEQQPSNQNRLITILNWVEYQSNEQQDEQPVNSEWTTSEQPVNTNKNDKNVKNIINKEYQKKYSDGCFEMQCVNYLIRSIKEEMPNAKVPSTDIALDKWCDHIEKMIRLDKRTEDDVYKVLVFARTDPFWKINIRSTSKFREKYETLYLQMKNKNSTSQPKKQQSINKFNQYPQRTYTADDYAELERKLINKGL
jgi:hypothetical protein